MPGLSDEDIAKVFVDLYDGWYSSVVRYVARRAGNLSFAEDLVHDCFLRLCRELRRGTSIHSPKGWLFRVIRNELSKTALSRSRHDAMLSIDSFEEPDTNPALAVEMDVEIGELTAMLWHLTVREEEVILLRLEGFSYAEIADALGIGRETVKTLIARAIARLRDLAQADAAKRRRWKKTDVETDTR